MLRYHVVLPAWGEEYVGLFLRFCLPTHLSSGNLGAQDIRRRLTYRIYTHPDDLPRFAGSPLFTRWQAEMDIAAVAVEPNLFRESDPYLAYNHCCRQGMADAQARGAACLLLTADQVWGEGSLAAVARHLEQGRRLVLATGPRVDRDSLLAEAGPVLELREHPWISLANRDAVRLALRHLHPWDRSLFWERGNLGRAASFMFWNVNHTGWVMRCFHLHPVGVNPASGYPDFSGTVDSGNFAQRACPDLADAWIATDSDEIMHFSIAPPHQSAAWIDRPQQDWRGILAWARAYGLYPRNLRYLDRTLRFHCEDIHPGWDAVEADSERLVSQVRTALDSPARLAWHRLLLALERQAGPAIGCASRGIRRCLGLPEARK